MSFLNADDTLADALAFLDSFDDVQPAPQPKKKRVRSARSTSTALQRRQKAETLQLRGQAAELQLQLERLRNLFQSRYDGNTVMIEGGGYDMKMKRKAGYDQAMTEYQERLQVEKDNCKLRGMLASQREISDALRGLLHKPSVLETLSFVQEKVQRPLNGASHCSVQLEKKVENLYCRSSMLFPDGPASISSHTVITNDERKGKVIEMVTVTPVACSVKDAGNLVWRYFEESWDQGTHPNSLEKNYVTTAASTVGLLKFEKWNYARRFEEPGRTVVAWTNLIFLPEHELTLHLQSSTVITCSDAGSVDASVTRSLVQLYSEPGDSCTKDHDKRSVHDTVLAFAGDVFRQHLQSQQNQLLQKVGSMERTLPIMA